MTSKTIEEERQANLIVCNRALAKADECCVILILFQSHILSRQGAKRTSLSKVRWFVHDTVFKVEPVREIPTTANFNHAKSQHARYYIVVCDYRVTT